MNETMSTTPFRNVALIGATGQLGSKILAALLDSHFTVTAIQRVDSTKVVAGAAKIQKVDLSNSADLVSAFKGQDVVISAVPLPRLEMEKVWIEAAILAGVRRVVLSEYSTNLETELSQSLPIVKEKLDTRKFVMNLASQGKVEWMSVNGGPFMLPWVWLSGWMGPNPKTKVATLHDGGKKVVCTSTLERIGEGVAKALMPEHIDSTKNKPVYVYSAVVSERKLVDLVAKITGSKLLETDSSITELTREANVAVERGDDTKNGNFYIAFAFGDGYGGDFRHLAWNKQFNLKEMIDEDLEREVKGWLERSAV